MDKKRAERYVLYGIKMTKFSKKMCFSFLPLYFIVFGVAVLLFHETIFIVIISSILLCEIISAIIIKSKWSIYTGFISQATQLLFLCLGLDFLNFSIYKISNEFICYEYIFSIVFQIVMLLISIPLVKRNAEKFQEKQSVINRKVYLIAGGAYGVTIFLGRFFLTEFTKSTIILIINFLINILIYLLEFIIVMALYRASLIKKFGITIKDIDIN